MEIVLRPVLMASEDRDRKIGRLEVEAVVTGMQGDASAPMFSLPSRIANLKAQVYGEGDIVASDEAGALTFKVTEQQPDPTNPILFRLFTPARKTVGRIARSYRAAVTSVTAPRTPGPSYDLCGIDRGFAGGAQSFLILPHEDDRTDALNGRWDMGAARAGPEGSPCWATAMSGHPVRSSACGRCSSPAGACTNLRATPASCHPILSAGPVPIRPLAVRPPRMAS